MEVTGIISLIIIAATCIISYKGFKSADFYAALEFEVEKIILYRDYKRFITSGFIHVNWQHLLFNVITLFFFSFGLEKAIGGIEFLLLYFISETGGNLLALLMHRKDPGYSAAGASGAINGIIYASIVLFPSLHIFFMPGWLFGLLFILYSVYGIRSQKNNIGHESHLGGALAGMLAAIAFYPSTLFDNTLTVLLLLVPTIALLTIILKKPGLLMVDNHWFNQKYNYTVDDHYNMRQHNTQQEVDRILDKINQKGINSLSRRERDILEEYSRK